MKLAKNPVFLHYFSKFMGILLFVLKYMYISFLFLKMINGFSWPAKIMASPFKGLFSDSSNLFIWHKFIDKDKNMHISIISVDCNFVFTSYYVYISRNIKGGIWSLFDPCVNAMEPRPYWPSRMEVTYCTFGFAPSFDMITLLLPRDLRHDSLYACVI